MGKFVNGHEKIGGRKTGTLNKKTLLLKNVGVDSLVDFKNLCYENLLYFLTHENDAIRLQATKEICKYLFSVPRLFDKESDVDFTD